MTAHKILISLFIFLTSLSFANSDEANEKQLLLLEEIIQNQDTCVKEFNEGKIYIQEDKLYPTDKGIFLILNKQNDYIHIPKLFSDERGCFIECTAEEQFAWPRNPRDPRRICPGCQLPYMIYCKNPDCRLKQKKEQNKPKK